MINRIGDFMVTYTGQKFYPLDPRPEDVNIIDIAHALSLMNRYGGHSEFPYSVAQHSVNCSLFVEKGFELEALLHDATEAYISDIVRPAKNSMPEYKAIEDNIWKKAIAPKFNLPQEISKEVHLVDNKMLVTEAPQLLAGPPWWTEKHWPKPFDLPIIMQDWTSVKESFLNRFKELTNENSVSGH